MDIGELLRHYKRPEIQKALIADSRDREIAVKFRTGGFGKRPDVLQFPQDVLALAQQGASSFHASEERWMNPLHIRPQMSPKEVADLRIGWDLVIDIDCKFLEYSKVAAHLVIRALHHHGIRSVSCKFSGGSGFHIGVPFEAFPETVYDKPIREWFPDGPRAIATYLSELIKPHLLNELLKDGGIEGVVAKTSIPFQDLVQRGKFNPFAVIGIDTLLISSRHLFRMAYSFNEKTGMVSVPVNPKKVMDFEKAIAVAQNVRVSKFTFLDRDKVVGSEATQLMVQAFDFHQKQSHGQEKKEKKEFEPLEEAVSEEFFSPCIKKILEGVVDGRKRCVFILINYLRSVGWSYDQIDARLREWNKVNHEPLREVTLLGQLRYHKQKGQRMLPPNCANLAYYADIGVKCEDALCQKFKNPVMCTRSKIRFLGKKKKK